MNVEPKPGDNPMNEQFQNPPVTLAMLISETIYQAVIGVERIFHQVTR